MYLKSLELQGFKSFPDKTRIKFGDDITAIVGPNGSGKSNISDAILWVMGEQSTKTLRGAKMEDVIFGGTQKRSPVGFAEATLTLDNSDRALSYDADEVMVTRRYYRSGESEYYINKQSARLRDINEMFMDTGLGREGYSNIGQGRIDEILSLKSGDRREIFEEAAGISKYRHRKLEAERKLEHTEDNLLRIGDKVSELEMQLEPLKTQSAKARQYLQFREELQGLEVTVWLDTLEKLAEAAKKAEEDYTSASFVLQQAHGDLDGLYRKAEELGAELHRKDQELETARAQASMLGAACQHLEGQAAVIRGNRENNDQNLERIRQELQGQDDRSGGLTVQIRLARERVEDLDRQLTEKKKNLEALNGQLEKMTASAQGMTRAYLELKSRETSLSAENAGQEADIRGLEQSIQQTDTRLQELQSDMETGTSRKQEVQSCLDRSREELQQAREDAAAAENTIAGYTLRQENREKRRDQLEESLRTITSEQDSVEAKLRVFEAMERDYESFQKSVRMVMQASRKGAIKNIYGPVSKLIRTEDSYTLAIEIALGGATQHVVVKDETAGKAAIYYLERSHGGRATFLPINTADPRYLKETDLEDCRGYVGIASELVETKELYQPIVDELLAKTVIVQDLDAAISMSRKYDRRFKIVTLDGQVINAGGSMTGGSVNRDAGILSRANELEKLKKLRSKLEADEQETDEALQEAQRQVDEVAFELTAARDQLRQAEDQVLRMEGQEQQYAALLNTFLEAEAGAGREQESLRQRLEADRQRLEDCRSQLQSRTAELEQTRQEIQKLESSQSETAEATAGLTETMTGIRTEAAAMEAEKATALSHIEDLEQLRRDMDGDREQKQALMETILQDNVRLDQALEELLSSQSETADQEQRMQKSTEEILEKRAQAEASKTKAERDAQEKNKEILNMERACAVLDQKRVTTSMEEKQIVDKLWDSYGLTPGTAREKRGKIESVTAGNRRIAELRRKISGLGTPNLGAIEEYDRVNERYSYLAGQRDDVLTSKRELEGIIRDITKEMTVIFVEEFGKIDHYFSETFEEMFGGGKGRLILEDPEDPLGCGIEIRVQPPGKQVKTITLLSGGEKAFVATALYFAILKVRPTPFCLLDEIDAALDDRNVERFAAYLHNLSQKTQFIVITHRRGTMEASDVLYGVTMQEQGVSTLLRLDLNQMEEYLGIVE